MSERKPEFLLEDILDASEKIISYTKEMSIDNFRIDDKTIDAVIRNFEIIGEAVNRLPDEFKIQYSEINWKRIRGFRNRIAHDYFGIDLNIVWKIIENQLPELIKNIKKIISL